MPEEKSKVLRYRRALFVETEEEGRENVGTLEEMLAAAHRKFTTIDQRRAAYEGGFTLEVRHAAKKRGIGTLLHLAAYTHEEPATIVPRVTGTDSAPVAIVPPPRNADFMDGDLMALIAGNDVILCGNRLSDRNLERYCARMFDLSGFPPAAGMFRLEPVADTDALQVLENQGVKEIKLSVSAFDASVSRAQRKSLRRRIGADVWDEFLSFFGKDADLESIRQHENVSADVVFKFDRRKKGGELAAEHMEQFARSLVDEEEEGFKIRTFEGTVLGASSLSLQKKVSLVAYGKSVARESAFEALQAYYGELKDAGLLDR